MDNNSDARGIASEEMVELALERLRVSPPDESLPRIERFVHAPRHSELDRNHVDFMIMFANGHEIPLQVKSSERHAKHFERQNRAHKYFIPVVVVSIGESLESVMSKIINCIRCAFKKLKAATERMVHLERIRRKKKRWFMRFHSSSMCH